MKKQNNIGEVGKFCRGFILVQFTDINPLHPFLSLSTPFIWMQSIMSEAQVPHHIGLTLTNLTARFNDQKGEIHISKMNSHIRNMYGHRKEKKNHREKK